MYKIDCLIVNSNGTENSQSMLKHLSLEEKFSIPNQKPEAKEILDLKTNLVITGTRLVQTPKEAIPEGKDLADWKLVIEGLLVQTVLYVANNLTQSVHAAKSDVPFSTYLNLPDGYKLYQPVQVEGCIENAYVKLIDGRCIFKNITFRIEGKYKY